MLDTHTDQAIPQTLFPALGSDARAWMRRIGVACDVAEVAKTIWSYGPGPRQNDTLQKSIAYYHRPNGIPLERWEAAFDFVAAFVPGGLNANLREFTIDQQRAMMADCLRVASEHEARYRKAYAVAK